MTRGEQFVESIPRKTRFYDRSERRSYELSRVVAARLIDEPSLVENGRDYAMRHMSTDPAQSEYFRMWDALLRRDAAEIVRSLLEDTPRGALLRDTQPVFCVLSPEVRQEIAARARSGPVTEAV